MFAGIFTSIEDWDYGTAMYHCLVTMTTVGYGDITIVHQSGKVTAVTKRRSHTPLARPFVATPAATSAMATPTSALAVTPKRIVARSPFVTSSCHTKPFSPHHFAVTRA